MIHDSAQVVAARPPRAAIDVWRPLKFLIEPERSASGAIDDTLTVFLAGAECRFKCVFCDLWKHSTLEPTPAGAIPAQLDMVLAELETSRQRSRPREGSSKSIDSGRSSPRQIKLYNSSNFFDGRAVPPEDYPAIADRVRAFQTVIVENHPRLCGDECRRFRDLIAPAELEVALGLETIHPDVLPRLNKQMTLDDFSRACDNLLHENIQLRSFILLRPPFVTEEAGVDWAVRSIDFALAAGVRCCSVIPTRGGNGWLDQLSLRGEFAEPRLSSLEAVLDRILPVPSGRVFVDLWDAERFAGCPACAPRRIERMMAMNRSQQRNPPIHCEICGR